MDSRLQILDIEETNELNEAELELVSGGIGNPDGGTRTQTCKQDSCDVD
jgi:hypothetical protein